MRGRHNNYSAHCVRDYKTSSSKGQKCVSINHAAYLTHGCYRYVILYSLLVLDKTFLKRLSLFVSDIGIDMFSKLGSQLTISHPEAIKHDDKKFSIIILKSHATHLVPGCSVILHSRFVLDKILIKCLSACVSDIGLDVFAKLGGY